MKRKTIRRILIAVAIVLVLLILGGFAAGNALYNLALNPAADRSIVFGAEHNQMTGSIEQEAITARREAQQAWFAQSGYTEITQTAFDGLRLNAYRFAQPGGEANDWVIVCHGYGGPGMLEPAQRFYEMGFNVLMPDARGHGKSEGDYIGMGWHDRLDIVKWAQGIATENPDARIALYGVSMGGATVMMTAGEPLPENVRAIVEDCGYTSVWDEFAYQLKAIFGLPSFPLMQFASAVTSLRAGWSFGEASAVEQLKRATVPMLFIHGDADTFVPSWMLDVVYEACAAPKERVMVEGAGHGAAAGVLGEAYWTLVEDFIHMNMAGDVRAS